MSKKIEFVSLGVFFKWPKVARLVAANFLVNGTGA